MLDFVSYCFYVGLDGRELIDFGEFIDDGFVVFVGFIKSIGWRVRKFGVYF